MKKQKLPKLTNIEPIEQIQLLQVIFNQKKKIKMFYKFQVIFKNLSK